MESAIRELHFHPRWFEYQLLPWSFFELQVERYHHGAEAVWRSKEHHRYFAFQTVLASRSELSDVQLEQYIELCQLDEDEAMARSALVNLLSWHGLSKEQQVRLTVHPSFSFSVAQKIIWRNRMNAELQSKPLSDQVFSEILARRDPAMERQLVACDAISRNQLEVLAEQGMNRAVRNIAKNRLERNGPPKGT